MTMKVCYRQKTCRPSLLAFSKSPLQLWGGGREGMFLLLTDKTPLQLWVENQAVEPLEISIRFCFCSGHRYKKISIIAQFSLAYWKAKVCLITSGWMDRQIDVFAYTKTQELISINFIAKFILNCCFESLWAPLITSTWNNWMNLLLSLIPFHMRKTNFITQLILEIKFTHYMPSHACLHPLEATN